jgi:hypothetical protein
MIWSYSSEGSALFLCELNSLAMSLQIFPSIKKRLTTSPLLAINVLFILIILFADLVNLNPWIHEQWVLSTTEQPEKITELSFVNPNSLPTTVTPGKPYTVSYNLHNLQSQTTKYDVRTSLVVNGSVQTISERKFTLPNDASVNLPVSFTATKPHENLELVIDVLNINESIYFRVAS